MSALIGSSPLYLKLTIEEDLHFFETIKRIEGIIDLFQIEQLHPNVSLQFYFAVAQCAAHKEDEALCEEYLARYVEHASHDLLPFRLKGDAYFDLLDVWFDTLDLGPAALREENVIRQSIVQSLDHPAFHLYADQDWFLNLKQKLQFQLGGRDE